MTTLTKPVEPIEFDFEELYAEVELSDEEILADLLYPAPPPTTD